MGITNRIMHIIHICDIAVAAFIGGAVVVTVAGGATGGHQIDHYTCLVLSFVGRRWRSW